MTVTIILTVSIMLQVVATLLALYLIRVTGRWSAWTLIAGAVALMTVRRVVTLTEVLAAGDGGGPPLSMRAELVALAISILMVLGLAALRPMFEQVRRTAELEAGLGRVLENSLSEFYIFAEDGWRFLRVNQGARENLGYSTLELAGMTPLDLKSELTAETFAQLLAPLRAGEVPRVGFTSAHRRKDGSRYPVVVDIQRTRFRGRAAFLSTILDLTDRDQAERMLRESEAHFRSLIEHSQDVTTVLETDGTIAYLSPSHEQILGDRAETRIGTSALERIHPEDVQEVVAALDAARGEPEVAHTLIYRVRHADGSWRTMEGFGSLRLLPDGRQQFVINQRDISRRAQALREKAAVEAQLQRAQRMEVLWTLAGGVAHDFNNLLTPIIGYGTLLQDQFAGQPEAQRDLREILRAAARAQKLVKQLLAFSRQTEQELLPMELEATVGEALELVRAFLPTSIAIDVELEAPGETVLADSTQIHQVIMNLCTNAEQAMRGREGALTVRLQRVEALPAAAGDQAGGVEGPFLHLSIGDTGPGIEEATLERIFDPFFTTKSVGEGTGLGLSIVQSIVLSHRGAITVDTAPGEGATFHLFLPVLGATVEQRPAEPEADGRGSERLLVVDDEPQVAAVVKRMLEARGFAVETAHGPQEALRLLASSGAVDLVITDQTMPTMTGLELAEHIHRARPALPIILVTGFSHAATPERQARAGIAAVVIKPFAGPELTRCVRSVLDSRPAPKD
jgi:PAS domain S-box-containing protein